MQKKVVAVAVGIGFIGLTVMGQEVVVKAEAKPKAKNPPEIVVTAVRDSRPAWQTPANVTVITDKDLRESGAQNLVEALKSVGGVEMRSISGNPATTEIAMRGFGENSHGRVLVLLDGHRLNSPSMASINWLQVPVSNIERVEVVRGGDSALYGDHAVAGIVNIITRKGSPESSLDLGVDAGSFGMSDMRFSMVGSQKRIVYSVAGERYESDGWRDRTGFVSAGGGGSVSYDLSDAMSVSLSVAGQNVEYKIPGWLTKEQMESNPRQSLSPNDEAEDMHWNADLGLTIQPSKTQRGSVNVAFTRKDTDSDMESWMSYADMIVDTLGVTPRYTFEGKMFDRKNTLVVGLDYYRDRLDVTRYADASESVETIVARLDKDTLGFYARDEFAITHSLVLGLGARTETEDVSARVSNSGVTEIDQKTEQDERALSASLIKTFEDKSKVFVRGGALYRYPFVDEQVSYVGFGADQFYTDIKPEEGWNLEAGTEMVVDGRTSVGLTAFMLNMKDEIAWDPMTMRNQNLDKTTRKGVETSFRIVPVLLLEVSGNYTFTMAEFTEGANDGKTVPLVPEHKASLTTKVMLPYDLNLEATVTYVGESYLGTDNANVGPKLSDYTVTDLFLRYTPAQVRGFEAHVGVENLFSEKYASLGYKGMTEDGYYPSPELAVKGGLAYRF